MGLPWTEFMDEQWESLPDLEAKAKSLEDPKVKIPEYYYAPIHAYKDGNLYSEEPRIIKLFKFKFIAKLDSKKYSVEDVRTILEFIDLKINWK
jgi:hypothetical protein